MRKKLIFLTIIFISSVSLVIFLYYNTERINDLDNHFQRTFAPHVVESQKSYDFGNKSWYFSLATKNKVILSNRRFINALLKINLNNFDTATIILRIPRVPVDNPQMVFYGNSFYITDGTLGNIYKLLSNNRKPVLIYNKQQFDIVVPISQDAFIFRTFDLKNGFILGKLESDKVTAISTFLESSRGNIMSNDGILISDDINKKIIYVRYYKNGYIEADYNLKIRYKGKTKDTVNFANVTLGTSDKKGKINVTSLPAVINKSAAVYNNLLFIYSALLADNENRDFFNQSSVIDVYDLKEHKYRFSFYISDFKNQKIKEFKVLGNKMVVLFENNCVIYSLNSKYLDN